MQKMFLDEVTERSARLVEGAQALRAGTVSPQEAGDLLREGHTIKGTGRVMGYDDVGSAGLMLEMIWRWIQQGDITPVPLFGRVLEGLSAAIPGRSMIRPSSPWRWPRFTSSSKDRSFRKSFHRLPRSTVQPAASSEEARAARCRTLRWRTDR